MLSDFRADCVAEDERADQADPLDTRLPDCPSGNPIILRPRTLPALVLFNVETTFQKMRPNQYMEQLSESFLFVPDSEDIQLYPEIFNAPPNYDAERDTLWNWERERAFVGQLLDPSRFQTITFKRWYESAADEVIISEDGLMETYIFPYDLEFVELPKDGATNSFGLRGRIEVDLVTPTSENPVWSIVRWQDLREADADILSFGELRAQFAP